MNIKTTHRIINGDCRDMSAVADDSVSLIVTSPPYWQLKDYGVSNQIGFDDDYETYINNLNLDFEYILLFKKPGSAPKPTAEQKELSKMTNAEWNAYFAGHWNFTGVKQDRHLAMFPDELPRRLIKMFSFAGETVLDPFAGSGTTAKMARELSRCSILYEINGDFIPLIKEKLGAGDLFSTVTFENGRAEIPADEMQGRVSALPYIFKDVHKLDKKTDVKLLQYGSKLDSASAGVREKLYCVRRVISPELVELNDGTIVRLIGIRPDNAKLKSAIDFLLRKFSGRRVFLKRDDVSYGDGFLPAYLYLDNKTFINAHLIKHGYAFVDESKPFAYMEKFTSLRKEIVNAEVVDEIRAEIDRLTE
jgi:site-specific DNA-methyltransferase (adenine-specific)